MNYKIEVSDKFKKHARHLLKKFPSLKHELEVLVSALETDPKLGNPIGLNCYKIRLAIASKGKGKSGGARVITHVHVNKTTFTCLQSTTNRNSRISLKTKSKNCFRFYNKYRT